MTFKKVDTMIYQPRRSDNYRGHNIQTYMYKNVKPDESLWNNQVSTAKLVELPRVYTDNRQQQLTTVFYHFRGGFRGIIRQYDFLHNHL